MTKSEFVLKEALAMNPSDRARIAHCLIYSLEEPMDGIDEDIEAAWIRLADQRMDDYENGKTETATWEDIKKKVKQNAAF